MSLDAPSQEVEALADPCSRGTTTSIGRWSSPFMEFGTVQRLSLPVPYLDGTGQFLGQPPLPYGRV
ncbi:MAG TPA: hypothetical protein VGL06_07875, partial [Pseudonocardiaceae bacterium]